MRPEEDGFTTRGQVINRPENLSGLDWVNILSNIYHSFGVRTPVVVPEPEPGNEFILAARRPSWLLVFRIMEQMNNELGFWENPFAKKIEYIDGDFVGRDRVMGFFGVRRSTPDPLDNRWARERAIFLAELRRLEKLYPRTT